MKPQRWTRAVLSATALSGLTLAALPAVSAEGTPSAARAVEELIPGPVGQILAAVLAIAGLGFIAGGLRHVDKGNVLEHPLRRALLDAVVAQPGVHLRELAGRFHTAVTNTQWHLRKLELAGLVKTQKAVGRRLYYPVSGGQASRDEALRNATLQNPNAETLCGFLAKMPGAPPSAMADALRMNPGTVRWHLRKLEATGVVRSVPDGSDKRYFLMAGPVAPRPPRPTMKVIERPAPKPRKRIPPPTGDANRAA